HARTSTSLFFLSCLPPAPPPPRLSRSVPTRGKPAEYTYYVDGVPVPAGISGSLNELFDPEVVNQIDFQTGGHGDAVHVIRVLGRSEEHTYELNSGKHNGLRPLLHRKNV